MKVKELREFFNNISPDFDDVDVLVDTEAATYTCHLVDITGASNQDFGEGFDKYVCLFLDNDCKIH